MDARDLLRSALAQTGEAQRALFARLSSALAGDPQLILALYPSITSLVTEGREPQPVQWAASIVELALRPVEQRPILAPQSLGAIKRLLASSDHRLEKVGIECFANVYPLLFKHACAGNEQHFWVNVIALKTSALKLWRTGGTGARTGAIKVIQRIIQTQTRGTADPRLQRTAEPNLSQVRPNHPFLRITTLEEEATKLLEECITALFTSDVADVVSGIATSLTSLVKARPGFTQLIITALTNWTPAALAKLPNSQVRSVEKSVRVSVTHLLKTSPPTSFEPYVPQVNDFLGRQLARMEAALVDAKLKREGEASRKRQLILDEITESVKRRRIEPAGESSSLGAAVFAGIAASNGTPAAMATLDATTLPLQTVVELVIATLQGQSEIAFAARISDARLAVSAESTPLPPPAPKVEVESFEQRMIKAEPIDPLNVDLGDEDLPDEPMPDASLSGPQVNDEDAGADEDADDFKFDETTGDAVSSLTLSASAKTFMIESAIRRICTAGTEGSAPAVWVPLVSRLITRGLRPEIGEGEGVGSERREALRKVMFEFVVEDMQTRLDFARLWLNEEWYADVNKNEELDEGRPYDRWLRRLLEHILHHSSNKDQSFVQFVVDLPTIPNEEISRFGEMCTNPEQVKLGFTALRDLAVMRPPVRQAALDVLLSLTTHPDKLTRNAAINTVKRSVPDVAALSDKVLAFSVAVLKRLETPPPPPPPPKPELHPDDMAESDDEDENEVKPRLDALVKDGEIIDGLPPATTEGAVVQHVELFFALSAKHPDLLQHLFEGFARIQPFAQEKILTLVTPLIKSLGVGNAKLIQLIGECPPGSEQLVLTILTILADKSRLPAPVVSVVRALAARRDDLSPRFLIMIISECDKAEMFKYLPRVVTVLNNTPEEKLIIRSVFLSVLAPASLSFAATANAVRQRHELLTPVELMVLLHTSEKQMGLKQTIEAINICFTMPDAFRPEILAAFMTQIVDEPVIPVLFLRTVIQAVTTYKALQPFVSQTLLMRLIQKKVWLTAPLWEGFIRCAKTTQPHSFNALLQLPLEQLADVVAKQPSLKAPLREFALKKPAHNNKMAKAALEVLGPDVEEGLPGAEQEEVGAAA